MQGLDLLPEIMAEETTGFWPKAWVLEQTVHDFDPVECAQTATDKNTARSLQTFRAYVINPLHRLLFPSFFFLPHPLQQLQSVSCRVRYSKELSTNCISVSCWSFPAIRAANFIGRRECHFTSERASINLQLASPAGHCLPHKFKLDRQSQRRKYHFDQQNDLPLICH